MTANPYIALAALFHRLAVWLGLEDAADWGDEEDDWPAPKPAPTTKLVWVPNIANVDAPTIAELSAGREIPVESVELDFAEDCGYEQQMTLAELRATFDPLHAEDDDWVADSAAVNTLADIRMQTAGERDFDMWEAGA